MKNEIKIGSWSIKTSGDGLFMGPAETSALRNLATRWIDAFPRGPETLAWRELGVPSSLIRFDYTLGDDGQPRVFEVEDRPAGLAIASRICPGFGDRLRSHLDALRAKLGRPIEVFVTESRRDTCDDALLPELVPGGFDAVHVGGEPNREAATYVRSSLAEPGLESLEASSISTVSMEGDKSYGVALGLWEEISGRSPLDYSRPFVTKPGQGCGSRGVMIYHPDRRGNGFETRGRIERAVASGEARYVQPFFQPERPLDGGIGHMIRRAVFAWNPNARRYEPIGGAWVSRSSAKVHGSADAITGWLQPEQCPS